MRLLGKCHLALLKGIDPSIDRWVSSWADEISRAVWKKPADIFTMYPLATHLGSDLFVFRVADSQCLVETQLGFSYEVVLITKVTN